MLLVMRVFIYLQTNGGGGVEGTGEGRAGDEPVDITPKEYAVRTVAQGSQSGGAVRVSADTDTIVFSNYSDQRLHKQSLTSSNIGGWYYT